jgi:UDP-glucose 4-epimerase
MRTLVTGGAGFIGSHLVDRLLADGHTVTVIDNCSTGRWENLDHIGDSDHLKKVEVDINDYNTIRPEFDGIDWVFHMAALADIVPSIEHPEAYFRSNVDGTFSVLQAAKDAGVRRFLYTASSSCYGIPDNYPTSEDAEIRSQYPYALTKNLGEQLAMHWAELYDLPVVCLRLFNVYGPRSRTSGTYGAVFGVFLAQKLAGKPYTVVGDGTQTRDFTFVTDVADAFVAAAESDIVGEIMNVGTGNPQSVNRLVELLGGEVTYIPKRPGEPDCTHADISKIKQLLNWESKVPMKDGVAQMLENIEYWSNAPVWTADSIEKETQSWFQYLS